MERGFPLNVSTRLIWNWLSSTLLQIKQERGNIEITDSDLGAGSKRILHRLSPPEKEFDRHNQSSHVGQYQHFVQSSLSDLITRSVCTSAHTTYRIRTSKADTQPLTNLFTKGCIFNWFRFQLRHVLLRLNCQSCDMNFSARMEQFCPIRVTAWLPNTVQHWLRVFHTFSRSQSRYHYPGLFFMSTLKYAMH